MSNSLGNISTIAKRELSAYFASPVAYVFTVIFLLLTAFFCFMLGKIFERGEASLYWFFIYHPWLYLILVPAIGMGVWAEERRQGTLELLLTMPITPWQAIVGKFIASWVFLGIALFLTFPVVLTVRYLGNPDMGVIVGSYIGSFLLAGAYLAVTCLTSSMTRNQVISFIISATVCLLMLLAGFPPVTDFFTHVLSSPPWVVELISSFSYYTHFEDFQRGVVDSRHLLFFLSVIGFSLFSTSVVLRGLRS